MADGDDDFGGFGDDGDDFGGDDFGFDDEFGSALEEAEMDAAEDKIKHAHSEMKSLPRTKSFAHSSDRQTPEPDSGGADADVPDENKFSRGGGVKGAEEEVTGEKSGWLKMLAHSKVQATLGRKPWKERWFVLGGGKLVIQAGPQNEKQQRTIDLSHAISFEQDDPEDGGDENRFSIVTRSKELFFTARNEAECKSWIANLKKAKDNRLGNFTTGHKQEGVSALMF